MINIHGILFPLSLLLSLLYYYFFWWKQNLLRDKRTARQRERTAGGPKWATPSHTVSKIWVSERLRSLNDKQEIKIQGRESLKSLGF